MKSIHNKYEFAENAIAFEKIKRSKAETHCHEEIITREAALSTFVATKVAMCRFLQLLRS